MIDVTDGWSNQDRCRNSQIPSSRVHYECFGCDVGSIAIYAYGSGNEYWASEEPRGTLTPAGCQRRSEPSQVQWVRARRSFTLPVDN
jgi:hypothetical protein